MIDIQLIRDKPEWVKEKSLQKNCSVDIDKLLKLDFERREMQSIIEKLRARRNEIAESMKGGRPTDELISEGKLLKLKLNEKENNLIEVDSRWLKLLKAVPNMPTEDTPIGNTELDNVVTKTWGEKPSFDFEPKNHWQIAEAKGWIDKERATKVAGSRFAYIKGDLVRMQFAIVQYVMDCLSNEQILKQIADSANLEISTKPFIPIIPPMMIKTDVFDAMGRLEPRDQRYRVGEPEDDLWLQGSAEHTIGSMYFKETLPESEMPIRYIGYATSFRREAGTYGKDMEGILRMHQFDKLEMESFTAPEHSYNEHLFFIAIQEYFMQSLGIHYELMLKCTADIGDPNARGVDLNAWLPGQDKFRETHSADYMTDYQSRRMQTRIKRTDGTIEFAHTNDATALVLSRTPIAIIENYQTNQGDVIVPRVLRPYMGGKEVI